MMILQKIKIWAGNSMGDYHETAIAEFLTIDGDVFIASQFPVAFDDQKRDGGSCPICGA